MPLVQQLHWTKPPNIKKIQEVTKTNNCLKMQSKYLKQNIYKCTGALCIVFLTTPLQQRNADQYTFMRRLYENRLPWKQRSDMLHAVSSSQIISIFDRTTWKCPLFLLRHCRLSAISSFYSRVIGPKGIPASAFIHTASHGVILLSICAGFNSLQFSSQTCKRLLYSISYLGISKCLLSELQRHSSRLVSCFWSQH